MIDAAAVTPPMSNRDALLKLLSAPNLCSKRWIWEQYDHLILGNTVGQPGGDAAVIRVKEGPKGLAVTTDVTARYCAADPIEGGKQAVAEAWRNITVRGATPLALTDNLNFGNPERPEIMGQFVGCLRGIGEAARALGFPDRLRQRLALQRDARARAFCPPPPSAASA
ncbi:AIR synthase related protein [Methylocystis parvus]|uniref:AIR synthase related protein n=1 Tax=Methylocystis parvus TaxID=134 RepID=UPI003C726E4C